MRLVLLRVVGRYGERPRLVRAVVRLIGLGLAIVPFLAGLFPSWSTAAAAPGRTSSPVPSSSMPTWSSLAGNLRSDTPSLAATDAVSGAERR